jgi:hypothetical protein
MLQLSAQDTQEQQERATRQLVSWQGHVHQNNDQTATLPQRSPDESHVYGTRMGGADSEVEHSELTSD